MTIELSIYFGIGAVARMCLSEFGVESQPRQVPHEHRKMRDARARAHTNTGTRMKWCVLIFLSRNGEQNGW